MSLQVSSPVCLLHHKTGTSAGHDGFTLQLWILVGSIFCSYTATKTDLPGFQDNRQQDMCYTDSTKKHGGLNKITRIVYMLNLFDAERAITVRFFGTYCEGVWLFLFYCYIKQHGGVLLQRQIRGILCLDISCSLKVRCRISDKKISKEQKTMSTPLYNS